MEKMNKEKEAYQKSVKDHIDKITTPIFDKVLQETKKNHTLVDSNQKISDTYSLYQPHNYRVYFDFKRVNFHPLRPSKPTYETDGGRLGIRNSKEWATQEQIEGCNLIIKKNQVQLMNKIDVKRWYLIEMGNIDKRKQQVMEIHQKKINEGIRALNAFIGAYGGESECKLLKIWCEEKVMKDKPIDKLPINMFFKAKNVKKAYNELNIEYFGDPIGAANYFSNRGIEDIAPQIANGLNTISSSINQLLTPAIEKLTVQINTHLAVQNEQLKNQRIMNKSLRLLNNKLSQSKLTKWV